MNKLTLFLLALVAAIGCNSSDEGECETERASFEEMIEQSKSCEVAADCGFTRDGCRSNWYPISVEAQDSTEYADVVQVYEVCLGGCGPKPGGAPNGQLACVEGVCVVDESAGTAGNGGQGD